LKTGEIPPVKTKHNKVLLRAIETIYIGEARNGVKKNYMDALKRTKKQDH
jgi:hypothetical protein